MIFTKCTFYRHYALKPLCRELQGLAGILAQACAEASAICSVCIPALQMFAKDLICFIPYWDRDPQCVSKVFTWTKKKQIKVSFFLIDHIFYVKSCKYITRHNFIIAPWLMRKSMNLILLYFYKNLYIYYVSTRKDRWSWNKGSSTMVLRQSQLSTSGDPAGLTLSSSSVPFSMPNKSFPISFTLLSTCILWDIASKTSFCASFFRREPSGALRNCQWTPKILNISLLDLVLGNPNYIWMFIHYV